MGSAVCENSSAIPGGTDCLQLCGVMPVEEASDTTPTSWLVRQLYNSSQTKLLILLKAYSLWEGMFNKMQFIGLVRWLSGYVSGIAGTC